MEDAVSSAFDPAENIGRVIITAEHGSHFAGAVLNRKIRGDQNAVFGLIDIVLYIVLSGKYIRKFRIFPVKCISGILMT